MSKYGVNGIMGVGNLEKWQKMKGFPPFYGFCCCVLGFVGLRFWI
jgi:hypothetical protein